VYDRRYGRIAELSKRLGGRRRPAASGQYNGLKASCGSPQLAFSIAGRITARHSCRTLCIHAARSNNCTGAMS
jgi:hypothetical protein